MYIPKAFTTFLGFHYLERSHDLATMCWPPHLVAAGCDEISSSTKVISSNIFIFDLNWIIFDLISRNVWILGILLLIAKIGIELNIYFCTKFVTLAHTFCYKWYYRLLAIWCIQWCILQFNLKHRHKQRNRYYLLQETIQMEGIMFAVRRKYNWRQNVSYCFIINFIFVSF